MVSVKVVVFAAVCAVACRFPELPALTGDASGSPDGSGDGGGSGGPNVVITSGPAANSMTGPHVTFEFTVRDGSPYCKFDNKPLAPCTSPLSVNLPAGPHTFHVQAENSGGTVDSDSRLWTIDCQPHQANADTYGLFRMEEGSGTEAVNSHTAAPTLNTNLRFAVAPHDPSWTLNGRFGKALHFESLVQNESDQVLATLLLNGTQQFGTHSVAMWVSPLPTFPHDLQLISTSGGNQTGRMDYYLTFRKTGAQGNFRLLVRDSNNPMTIVSQAVDVGAYHYVAISFSPGTPALLFVDGQTVQTPVPIQGTVDNYDFSGFQPFEGDLDELDLTFHRYTEAELLDQYCPL